jgi:hypothetical protein
MVKVAPPLRLYRTDVIPLAVGCRRGWVRKRLTRLLPPTLVIVTILVLASTTDLLAF